LPFILRKYDSAVSDQNKAHSARVCTPKRKYEATYIVDITGSIKP